MRVEVESECAEMLTDLLCYEIGLGRLSEEIEAILAHHLEHCSSCRSRFHAFIEVMGKDPTVRNFG
jgi:hypothetical protein